MLIKILLFLFIFFSISLFAKGEIQKIYAHYENAKPSSYTIRGHTYKWGQGKNIVIDGFEYNGHKYNYTGAYGNVVVKVRRSDNSNASGKPCELFAVKHNNNNYQYTSTFPQKDGKCDMATVMGGRIISVGALDLFRNTGYSAKNIERVDFITPNGITAPTNSADLAKAGHVVTEKSGNNPIKIAAILSLDANGDPASYGPLVGVHTGEQIDYGLTTIYFPDGSTSYSRSQAFLIDNKHSSQGYPYYYGTYNEALGMAFVSLQDLGISAGQKYYGFSYFGRDVTNSMNLVNYNSFPKNTNGDTADPYGGVEGYFVDESILPPNGMILTAGNGDDYDKTNIYVFHIDVDTDKVTGFHQINKVNKKFRSLAYKDGKFYTVDNSNGDIYSIDINTGNLTRENSLGSIGVSNVVSMDFDDSEHILYTTCGICHGCVNNIKKFDISSQTTTIDTTLENEEAMGGLAWYGNNKYVVSVTSNMVRDIKNSTPQNNSDSQNYIEYGCGAEYVGNGKAYFISALEGNDDIFKYENNKVTSIFHFRSLTNGDDAVAIAIKHKHNTPPPSKTFECGSESYISFNTSFWGSTYGDSQFDTISISDGQLKNHKILNGVKGVNSIGYNIIDNYIWGYNLNSKKIVRIDADGNTKLYNRPSGLPKGFYIDADVDKNGVLYLAENNTNTIYRVDVNPNSSTFLKALSPLKLKNNVKIYTADFAFNPKDGKLYYIDKQGKVYNIDTNTGMRKFVVDSGLGNTRPVIAFFDKDGNFYFNFDIDKLYKIDINNPKAAIFFTNLDKNLKNGDGARCPNASVSIEDNTSNTCENSFPSAVSSTYDEVQINQDSKIYGTTNHTIITKVLKAQSNVQCDNAPCIKSNTLADNIKFNLDLGSGKDGEKILDDGNSITISSNKEYKKFQAGKNNDITINGDVTIKSQSDFYINSNSKIHINGNVIIYANKFDSNQKGVFYINGSLKIYANTFYLNSGNKSQHIPSADKFVVFAKKIVDINSYVDLKGIFYSDGDIQINDHTKITGALTGNYIDINKNATINYDKNAVNNFCNPKSKINITLPTSISIIEGDSGTKNISFKLTANKTIPSDVTFSYSLSNGSAKKNQDYQDGGTLTFSKDTITIPNVIKGDKEAESDEYFYITLSSSDNRIEFINNKIKVNIINDDLRFVITDCPTMCKDTIGTKIVNKSFRINIFSINQNKDEVKNTIAKKVQIRIKNSSNQAITSWKNIDIYNKSRTYINLKSSKIDKNVKIELKWFNTETNTTEYQTSTDNFAIRPKKFKFTLPTTQIAGDQFRFKVEALDNNNRNVKDYNEHEGVSFTFSKKDKKSPTCKTGHITLSKYLNFKDGLFEDNSAKYDNVGVVDFKLAEKNDGSEFASVDRADTSNSDRLISPASATVTFIPKKFHINAVLNDVVGINPALKCPSKYPKKYITYYANNPSTMGANLDINISTTTANGDVLTNYTDGCYSKNTNITVYYKNSNNIDNQSLISNKSFASKDTYKFIISIDKSLFYNGKTDQNIKLNLSRNNKIAKNPSLFTIKSIKVNDDKTSSTIKLTSNNKAHFYYGRVHVSSPQETSQTYLDAKVYYEIYCKNCDKTIFTLANGSVSVDDVYWYILPKSIYSNFGSGVCDYHSPRATNGANPTHKDEATIHIIAPTIPHNDKIYYTPNQTYLRYNKFGTALPEHFFDVKFIVNTPVWAGRGKLGNTIDTNISKIPNRALEW